MYLQYVTKIYILTLLKISYELLIGLIIIMFLMAIIRFISGDRYYFTKKLNKIRRYILG